MFKLKFMVCSLLAIFGIQSIEACTGIVRKAENGDIVYARTMEFGTEYLTFDLLFVPREIAYTAHTPTDQPGIRWKTKYAHVGFNPRKMDVVVDGLNEKGLGCGAFYFPGWAEYEKVPNNELANSISNLDFVSWVLGNYATVAEVREALKTVKVTGVVYKEMGIVSPLHYIVVDASGDKAVIEYQNGQLHIYEAPLGTLTNSPDYGWHMTNARNYIGLRALNRPAVKIGGEEIAQFGQGSGALGLPGDFTPPSRFIRAAFLRAVALPGKDGMDEIKKTFKILNQFDIPKGAIHAVQDGKDLFEETQWTSASDLAGRRYFFHTYTTRAIRMVDLKAMDVNAKATKSISVDTPEHIQDISKELN